MKNKKIFILMLLIFPVIIKGIFIFISNGTSISYSFSLKNIFLNFCKIVMENMEFYATCFSLIWAIEVYFKQQEDLRVSIYADNKKNHEIRLKELEQYKDKFRPNFTLSPDEKKLILIMKNNDYYLENVYYYKSDTDKGKRFISLGHRMEIDLEGAINNYFVTADTLIGEKVIFGVILNNLKVYKLLKEDSSPIIPSNFMDLNNNIEKKINENWVSFNIGDIKDTSQNSKSIDINFMYKTRSIREKMALNITEYMKEILSIKSVKEMFVVVLGCISLDKNEFSNTIRQRVIYELKEILDENLDRITIYPNKIEKNTWKYISRKSGVEHILSDDKNYAASYIINQYIDTMSSKNIDIIIFVFLEIMRNANFSEQLEYNVEIYKVRILGCIEN